MNKEDRKTYKLKRRGKGINLEEVAEYVGFSISTISRYENDKINMEEYRVARYKEYIENKEI